MKLQIDLSQLTTVAAYVDAGMADQEATFELHAAALPAGHGYLVSAGQDSCLDATLRLGFTAADIAALRRLPALAHVGSEFFERLATLAFEGDVWGVPEGTVVFAGEPILRVTGPLVAVQLLEAELTSVVATQTQVATLAARITRAAGALPVLDFGLHRQGGAPARAARAAFLGGCLATTCVEAAIEYGIPAVATAGHAHTLAHHSEEVAFSNYCRSLGEESILTVDTYDPGRGAMRAAQVGRIRGVRVASGDLLGAARWARRALDLAGRTDASLLVTGALDEHRVAALVAGVAGASSFGISGTCGMPPLEVVYELVSFTPPGARAEPCLRLIAGEPTYPGPRQVWRHFDDQGIAIRDVMGLASEDDPHTGSPLLVPMIRAGARVHAPPTLADCQHAVRCAIDDLPPAVRDLDAAGVFPVEVSSALQSLRLRLASHRKSEQ